MKVQREWDSETERESYPNTEVPSAIASRNQVGKHYYLCSVIIWNIMYVCGYMILKLGTWKFEVWNLSFGI